MQQKALTIAGSDSGGGAGIQADLKTFAALDVYGSSVLTAVTAQNTLKVTGVQEISVELIGLQIDAVMQDIGAAAVKSGMLSSAEIIQTVAAKIREYSIARYVLDPVMIAKSGDKLLADSAIESLIRELVPLAYVITPNVPEAEVLTGIRIRTGDDAREAAVAIHKLGATLVVVKGGHLGSNRSVDIFYDGANFEALESERIDTKNTHGTGCTFSAAITAFLARDFEPATAVRESKRFITEAIRSAYGIGQGHSPVNHFHAFTKEPT